MKQVTFNDFLEVDVTGELDVDTITVSIDEKLQSTIINALQFMKDNPSVYRVGVLLKKDQYEVEPRGYGYELEDDAYVELFIYYNGTVAVQVVSMYSVAESQPVEVAEVQEETLV